MRRTLGHVRTLLLTLPPDTFEALLAEMEESTAVDGLVARAAARLQKKADRERSGVISTAQSHTHFLDSPRMTTVLARSSVDFAMLKCEPTTVYLVLPPGATARSPRQLRALVPPHDRVCAPRADARDRARSRARGVSVGRVCAFGADDAGAAGHWPRGRVRRTLLAYRDRTSHSCARPTVTRGRPFANSDALQVFGTNDWDTTEYVSKMTGGATVRVTSDNRSTSVSRGRTSHRQLGAARTTTEHARRLLTPDEVRRLPRDEQLLFLRGDAPLRSDG